MITRLNPTNTVSQTKKLSNQASEQTNANIGQASDFALNQSGLNQKMRQTNDQLTELLSRQNALEKGSEKLDRAPSDDKHNDMVSELNNEIRQTGLFTGTSFEQQLDKLLTSEKPLVKSIQQSIRAELKELTGSIADKVALTQNESLNADQLVQKFHTVLKGNPQDLNQAYSTINSEMVYGLLGNSAR
ncbi:MAG: hypothetical protein OEX19_12300 [Gammaproteobacteria bacterium]|nr:hypothetical protein [Gammaproteobacteria bacterium]